MMHDTCLETYSNKSTNLYSSSSSSSEDLANNNSNDNSFEMIIEYFSLFFIIIKLLKSSYKPNIIFSLFSFVNDIFKKKASKKERKCSTATRNEDATKKTTPARLRQNCARTGNLEVHANMATMYIFVYLNHVNNHC